MFYNYTNTHNITPLLQIHIQWTPVLSAHLKSTDLGIISSNIESHHLTSLWSKVLSLSLVCSRVWRCGGEGTESGHEISFVFLIIIYYTLVFYTR